MTKSDVARKLVAKRPELTLKQAEGLVDAMLDTLKEGIESDGIIALKGFGTFKKVTRAARQGRNPATGASISIPAKDKVVFNQSSTFKL